MSFDDFYCCFGNRFACSFVLEAEPKLILVRLDISIHVVTLRSTLPLLI